MALIQDLIEGASITENESGFEVTRIFIVTEVSGDPASKMYQALNTAGIPIRGDFHPTVPSVQVDTRTATPLSQDQMRVEVTYRVLPSSSLPPGENEMPTITVGATVQEQETNLDINGEVMTVSHTYTEEEAAELPKRPNQVTNDDGTVTEEQVGTINVNIPQLILKFSRREKRDPYDKAFEYVGYVNSSIFYNVNPGCYLCTRIEGTSTDGGKTYQVDYEFQFNNEGWFATVVYVDPEKNAPLSDATAETDTDIRTFTIYGSKDFNALNLSRL